MAAIIVAAIFFRFLLLATNMNPIDADQAITGLMAKHILNGERPLFYYGLSYQGTLEAYLTAPLIYIFGMNRVVIRITTMVLSIILIYINYLLGIQIFDQKIGLLAALFTAFPPFVLMQRSLTADSNYIMVLVSGGICLLLTNKIVHNFSKTYLFFWMVTFLFGFWAHPTMVYYLLTLVIVFAVSKVKIKKLFPSTVMIVTTISGIFALTILTIRWVARFSQEIYWLSEYLTTIFAITIPASFGLLIQSPYGNGSLFGKIGLNDASLNIGISCIALFISIYVSLKLINNGKPTLPIFGFITLYLYISFSILIHINPSTLIAPRYLVPIYSCIPLGIYIISYLLKKHYLFQTIIIGFLISINVLGTLNVKPITMPYQLLSWLMDRKDRQYIYTDYWLGYWLAFESQEKVIPFVISETNQIGYNRYPGYAQMVQNSTKSLYIFEVTRENQVAFQDYLISHQIRFESQELDGYIIYYDLEKPIKFPLSE